MGDGDVIVLISISPCLIIGSMRPAAVLWRAAVCVAIAGGAIGCVLAHLHSPVRGTLAILTLMVVPGEGVALAIGIDDPMLELAVAVGGSVALGSIVSLTLLYVHAWSLGLATGILVGIAVAGFILGLRNTGRNTGSQKVSAR